MKVAHVELFQGDARLVLRYAVTATYGNQEGKVAEKFFCSPRTKSKAKEKFYNSMPYALHDLHTSKRKRPHSRPYDASLQKLAKCNKVRTSKHLRFVPSIKTFNGNQPLKLLTKALTTALLIATVPTIIINVTNPGSRNTGFVVTSKVLTTTCICTVLT